MYGRRLRCFESRYPFRPHAKLKNSISLLYCGIRIRFNHHIYLRAWLETSLLAILVSNDILYANFAIQVLGFVNFDLRLLWFVCKGLDDSLDPATQLLALLAHAEPPRADMTQPN